MGMYNEVYKSCPHCDKMCESQISQIVLGFGELEVFGTEYNSEEY